MLFNSLEFAVFLPTVFAIYWLLKRYSYKVQNSFLLIASYVFYGWWDWRFLGLILLSTIADYFIGIKLHQSSKSRKRKGLLYLSLSINLGILGFFKYFNFFVDSFSDAFTFLGQSFESNRLDIILPVGISFYTFQTLSYSIDIYRRQIDHTKDFVAFASFVSFFPQLVAGPIERASNLLPQFNRSREFSYEKAADGMRQILWGFFKKIVIADRCAVIADSIFTNYTDHNASTLIVGAIAFTFQIYGDFSGYSDIAIGTSKLFGFDLMTNFKVPYFSRNIAEFWNRWHISLSSWFRDYLYIPLGGSRINKRKTLINVIIVFTVSGFWHGANWTFIVWGLFNGLLFIPLLLANRHKKYSRDMRHGTDSFWNRQLLSRIGTLILIMFLWIIFRAESIQEAYGYISGIFNITILAKPIWIKEFLIVGFWILLMLVIEWKNQEREHQFEIGDWKTLSRRSLYAVLILAIFFFGKFESNSFIYFQF